MATQTDWLAAARTMLADGALPAGCLPPLPGDPDAAPLAMPSSWRASAAIEPSDLEATTAAIAVAVRSGAEALTFLGPGTRSAMRHAGSLSAASSDGADPAGGVRFASALAGVADLALPIRLVLASPEQARSAIKALQQALRRRAAGATSTVCLDPISELATHGPRAAGWASRIVRAVALAEELAKALDSGTAPPVQCTFVADGRPFHEAGASTGLELGCTLSAAVLYARQLMAVGWPAVQAFSAISFAVPVTVDWLESAAKLRALQQLWRGVQELAGVQGGIVPVIHAETSWPMLATKDPDTEILRASLAAFAAAVGGCHELTVLPHILADTGARSTSVAAPDQAARLALTLQHLLRQEAMVRRIADPGAGSGAIEAETARLAEEAWHVLQSMEATRAGLPLLVAELSDGTLEARIAAEGQQRGPLRLFGGTDNAGKPAPAPLPAIPFHLPARRWLAAP